ncbi:hypothetical protein R6Q57_024584 [Mikania cordata]
MKLMLYQTSTFLQYLWKRIIRSDLPVNLQAIARRSERSFEGNENMSTEVYSATPIVACATIDIDGTLDKNIPTVASKHAAEVNNNWECLAKLARLTALARWMKFILGDLMAYW